ncbi:hypothetical protein [Saccharothrix sp. NRRL B-16348]|uniref:hypothetical protein n=1 Tax=Saccharothrix sp. NRRL B-16348 TaxID=1415542 RepID=UPI0012FB73C4|nr:hypothetical protein [Saccharothrix sp. NRRL B-16348]
MGVRILLIILVVLVGLTLFGVSPEAAVALVSSGALLAVEVSSRLVRPVSEVAR